MLSPDDDEGLRLLRELHADVRKLLDLVERKRPSLTDAALLARLRPAIGGLLGSEPFAASDLIDEAGTPEGAALRVVLHPLEDWNAKRLGMLLGRGEGVVVDGYKIEHISEGRNDALWRVLQVGGFHNPPNPQP